MVWKSRENEYPKPDFLARLLAYLRLAYPGAELTEDVLRELWPFILSEWRHGKDERGVATSTCSCDGVRIVPSPGVQVALANKRIVRAPKDAQPNQVFGLAALRASSRIERLRLAMQIVQRKLQLKDEALLSIEASLPRARSKRRKDELLRRQNELLAEKQSLGGDLTRMQQEYAETIQGVEKIIEPLGVPAARKKQAPAKKAANESAATATAAKPKPKVKEKKADGGAAKVKTADTAKDAAEGCGCQTAEEAAVPDVMAQDLVGLLNSMAGGLDPLEMAGLAKSEGA